MVTLSSGQLVQRAKALRMVITDVDGVLTDSGVYYSAQGEELKRFSVRDGMAVELLRASGIDTAFLTRESSAPVIARASKLAIKHVFVGIHDKAQHLPEVLKTSGLNAEQLGYIGDDVNDLEILQRIKDAGLCAAPADAVSVVLEAVHYRCRSAGGYGAFREFADWLLALRH